jgi:uncharacterized protein (DUF952 family)
MTMTLIYKVHPGADWAGAEARGVFCGAPVDLADGFIHFSTAAQLPVTLAKHFAGQPGLLLIAVKAASLGPELRFEPSRGGALFPHLYAPLPLSAVRWVEPLRLDANGVHLLPEGLV